MDSVETLADRWRLSYRTPEFGTRRQLVGSLLEADPEQSLSRPAAVRLLPAVDQSEEMPEHLIEGDHSHDDSSVTA